MSKIIQTDLGRFNITTSTPLFECSCGEWLTLSEDQAKGRVSVDHASMSCPAGYHETHDYLAALMAKKTAAVLTGGELFDGGEL